MKSRKPLHSSTISSHSLNSRHSVVTWASSLLFITTGSNDTIKKITAHKVFRKQWIPNTFRVACFSLYPRFIFAGVCTALCRDLFICSVTWLFRRLTVTAQAPSADPLSFDSPSPSPSHCAGNLILWRTAGSLLMNECASRPSRWTRAQDFYSLQVNTGALLLPAVRFFNSLQVIR